MPHPLARIIEQLKREPSRTGSIVITVFGDAIVPRGGSVWLGTLLEFFESARHRRRRGAHRDVAARRRRLARARQGRPQQLLSAGEEGTADLRYRHQTHLRSAAVRLDRPLRAAADRQWRGPRRLARSAEECRLRQSAAGRLGRAVGRARAGGSRGRDPARSLRRGRQRPTAAQRELAAAIAPRTPI